MDYFASEGIACEIKDGELLFKFNDSIYTLQLGTGDDYAECAIVYECAADEYVSLELTDKTFIADKVNTDLYNHATVYAYGDSIKIDSTFYFTSKKMWTSLFIKHFNELNEAVAMAMDIICEKIADDDKDDTFKITRVQVYVFRNVPAGAESTEDRMEKNIYLYLCKLQFKYNIKKLTIVYI